jgi:hypothetical protein
MLAGTADMWCAQLDQRAVADCFAAQLYKRCPADHNLLHVSLPAHLSQLHHGVCQLVPFIIQQVTYRQQTTEANSHDKC